MAGNNNRYSNAEMMQMRRDAIRRTEEMHRRAAGGKNRPMQEGKTPPSMPNSSVKSDQPPPHFDQHSTNTVFKPELNAVLDKLGLDGERVILLLIIMLLVKDGADGKLIMALLYLLI